MRFFTHLFGERATGSSHTPHLEARGPLWVVMAMALVSALLVACGPSNDVAPTLNAAVPITFKDVTFAGRTSNADMFAAVVTHATGVEAYFCDGKKDYWFRGLASDSAIEMSEASGGKLVLEVANDFVVGRLTVGETVTTFEIPKALSDSLYRAETFMGEQRILAGWIKLPNGEQRGTIRNGTVTLPSTLDISNVTAPKAICSACSAFVGALTPAAFTPEEAQRKVNSPQTFTVIGMGDSFMSGEGAPVTLGDLPFRPGFVSGPLGFPIPGTIGFEETWSSGLPTSNGQRNFNLSSADRTRLAREARACHRGASGLGLAVNELRDIWPASVDIIHQTFACSGAKVANLVDLFNSGPAGCALEDGLKKMNCLSVSDDLPDADIRPQFPEALDFLAVQRLKADAVVMSIGGNDLGFGDVLTDCITGDCWKSDSAANKAVNEGVRSLEGRYDVLADRFASNGLLPGNVYLTSHPNPLRLNANRLCAGTDFGFDVVLAAISDEDSVFATSVLNTINKQVANAVARNNWKSVTSHLGTELNHGICSTQPWYNGVKSASATQGADLPSYIPGLYLSAGMVHPNQAGQRDGYRPAYQERLNIALTTRFTPKVPTRFRAGNFYRDGTFDLLWDDTNNFESKTVIRNEIGGQITEVPADRTGKTIELRGKGTFRAKACFTGPRNVDICSPETPPITVEVAVPTDKAKVLKNEIVSAGVFSQTTITWRDLSPSRLWTTLELVDGSSGAVTKQAVSGQGITLPNPVPGSLFRIAACNDLGCGPATERMLIARSASLDLAPCPTPQKRLINGQCGLTDKISVPPGLAPGLPK